MSQNRTLVLATLAFVLALGTAGVYLLTRAPAGPGQVARGEGDRSEAPVALTSHGPSVLRELEGSEAEDARASVDAAEPSARGFSLDGARWFDVQVAVPVGTPADEDLRLFAISFGEPELSHEEAWSREGLAPEVEAALAQSEPVFTGRSRSMEPVECERAPNGVFRAPFAEDAARGALKLEGHYLFLEDDVPVDLEGAKAITLEPELGGRLIVTFQLPARPPEDFSLATMEPFEVNLMGWSMGSGSGSHHDVGTVGPGLELDLGGLPGGLSYFLNADPGVFTSLADASIPVEAGQTLRRDYQLVTGARLRGRVVDASGAGVGEAVVSAEVESGPMLFGGGHERQSVSAEDGTFDLRAVTPGTNTLTAEAQGYADAEPLELELSDLQELAGVTLTLPTGNRVSGRLTWPDGSPAAGERVRLVEPTATEGGRTFWISEESYDEETDAEGLFVFVGLGDGPFELSAEATRVRAEEPAEGSRVGTASTETWRVRKSDVPPGADVHLALEPPIGVRGIVVDDLGAPVTKFMVSVGDALENEAPWQRTGGSEGEAFEDPEGRFLLASLGRGSWNVTVLADGYGDSEMRTLTLPGETGPFTFVVPRAARIRGTVLDPLGNPAPGASVEAREPGRRGRWMGGAASEETDEQGTFLFEDVAPGSIELVASAEDAASNEPLPLDVQAAGEYADLVLQLRVGGTLTGEIYAEGGGADVGRQITANQPFGADSRSTVSDSAGQFRIEHLAAGTWQVIAMPDMSQIGRDDVDQAEMMSQLKMDSVEIVDGETVHVVLGAPPTDPVALTGRVTLAGRAVEGYTVMALAEGEALLSSMKIARTGEDGTFALTLPAPGAWVLMVGEDMGNEGSEFPIDVPAGESHHVELEIPRGRIAGRVIAPDGSPAANVGVSLASDGVISFFGASGGRDASSDAEGRFAFENLRPGRYGLRAGSASPFFFGGEGRPQHGTTVLGGLELEEGSAIEGIELRLARPGALVGVVRKADGTPATDASVHVRNAAGQVLNPMSWCMTDSEGRFRFDSASPGTYTLSARGSDGASRESAAVDVAEGAETEVELALEPGTILRVSVEDGEGASVRARVDVFDEAGHLVSGLRGADAQELLMTEGISTREQRVGPLAPGRYRVTASTAEGASGSKSVTLRGQDERKLRVRVKD